MSKNSNRIEITQWREHGDDEDSLDVRVFGANVETRAAEEIAEEYELHLGCDENGEEDTHRLMYTVGEATLIDGEIIEHNDRKFLLTITEVK